MRVAVVGATGFVGSHLVPYLVERGHAVIAISRDGRRLPDWTDAVEARAAGVVDGDLDAALAGAEAVVHLAAIPRETGGRQFEAVNVRGTERGVAAAERAGARRLVHLSVLGVTDDPKLAYLHSKWRGERAVRDSKIDWVVLRPSLMFGTGDGFFNLVKTTLRWWSPGIVAIPGRGDTRFQPLSVDDLAIGIERSVTDDGHSRAIHELGGPDYWTYRQIVDEVMRVTGMRRLPGHRRDRSHPADVPGQPRPDRLVVAAELDGPRRLRARLRGRATADGPLIPGSGPSLTFGWHRPPRRLDLDPGPRHAQRASPSGRR